VQQEEIAMANKKRWSELSPEARTAIVVGGVLEVIVTSVALRDLRRRPRGDVRGWKPLWLLGFAVQPVGPLLYLFVGRRHTSD
jgi:hypothetical protein